MQTLEHPKINNPQTYTDDTGITHIYVSDTGITYELVNGEWLEKLPF